MTEVAVGMVIPQFIIDIDIREGWVINPNDETERFTINNIDTGRELSPNSVHTTNPFKTFPMNADKFIENVKHGESMGCVIIVGHRIEA